jgi:hypothetical protein
MPLQPPINQRSAFVSWPPDFKRFRLAVHHPVVRNALRLQEPPLGDSVVPRRPRRQNLRGEQETGHESVCARHASIDRGHDEQIRLETYVRKEPDFARPESELAQPMRQDVVVDRLGQAENDALMTAAGRRRHQQFSVHELESRHDPFALIDQVVDLFDRPSTVSQSWHGHKMLLGETRPQLGIVYDVNSPPEQSIAPLLAGTNQRTMVVYERPRDSYVRPPLDSSRITNPMRILRLAAFSLLAPALLAAQTSQDPRLDRLKAEVAKAIDGRAKMAQQMVDQVFSFGELGMQEFETSKYLTGILAQNGFTIERGVAGIPTAWVAKWGSGKPVIALGSDIDGIPQANQRPGTAARDWVVTGAPGHGEGHNSGVPLNILAALAVKDVMTRDKIPGTIMLWPGVAEEQLGSKAYYVRAGLFKDVDANLFAHVSDEFGISWGDEPALTLISPIFKFKGQSAHAAGAPWRGKSALDAVMNMANS